jgi:hypothetical protein
MTMTDTVLARSNSFVWAMRPASEQPREEQFWPRIT